MAKWKKTSYPGVRFREHPTRKHGVQPDKYFTIRYWLGEKQREEGLGWASKGMTAKEANETLSELKKAHRTGDGASTLQERRKAKENKRRKAERDSLTFAKAFDKYFPDQAHKSKRGQAREMELFKKYIKPVIGDMPLKGVAPINLQRIKKNMEEAGLSWRSVEYCLATIRQVYNYARRNDMFIGDSPTSKLPPLKKTDNRRLRFLSHEEADSLLEVLAKQDMDLHDMALLSLHTGCRAGEIFALTWYDVDLKRGILTLRDTKSGRNRTAFLTEAAKKMLKRRGPDDKNVLVFPDKQGRMRKDISKAFKEAVDVLKLNDGITDRRQRLVFHSLRHTFASWLAEGGVSLYVIKELLGHRTLAMTERYSHLGNNTLQGAVKNLESSIKKRKKGKVYGVKK